jgi:hypothetical protein
VNDGDGGIRMATVSGEEPPASGKRDPASRPTGPVLGSLLITVWRHDGVLVGRLWGYRGVHDRPRKYATVAGADALLATVAEWLRTVQLPADDQPGGSPQ